MRPDGWSKWYAECEKAFYKQKQAKERKARTGTPRRASKCGFCGSLHHNRRQCTQMDNYTDRIIKANQVWRQRFYDKFVTEQGLSIGAVVKVKTQAGWNSESEEKIGIITGVNWDQLSMFCYTNENGSWHDRLDQRFRQQVNIDIMIDGQSQKLRWVNNTNRRNGGSGEVLADNHGVLADSFSGYRGVTYIETIGRSETPLDEEWVSQGHEECAKFVTKKYSAEKLKDAKVTQILELTEQMQKNIS